MSLLGRVAAAVGGYLVEQGKLQDELSLENAKDELLFNRELALKNVDAQIADKHDATEQANALARIDRTSSDQQQTDVVQGVIQSRIRGQEQAADLTKGIVLENLRSTHEVQLAKLQKDLHVDENTAEQMLANKLSGGKIVKWDVTSDGRQIGYDQYGHTIAQSKTPGAFPIPGAASNPLDTAPSFPTPTTTGPVPQSSSSSSYSSMSANPSSFNPTDTAPPGKGKSAAALTQLSSIYVRAQQDPDTYRSQYPGLFDASGNLLPMDQAAAKVKQAYGD